MRDAENARRYHREWNKRVRRARRAAWIAENGPCKRCGSTERLEVDHIDPSSKEYEVHAVWTLGAEIRERELARCQVLCRKCHESKNAVESRERNGGAPECGTYSGYIHGCRCDGCRKCNTEYAKQRRRRMGVAERVIVDQPPVPGVTHGTRAAYERAGCRCRPCRDFNAARSQARRDQQVSA